MASPTLAHIMDLAARLGCSVDVLDGPRALGNLQDASTLVRQATGATYLDDDGDLTTVPDVVEMVTLAVAKRAYENPNGVTQKTAGDVSMSFASRSESAVYLTADEVRLLRGLVGRTGLHTVRTTRDDPIETTVFVPIEGTTAEFPWYASDDPLVFPS